MSASFATTNAQQRDSRAVSRRLAPLLLALIVLGAMAGSLLWIRANTILMGRDASGYLLTSLEYRSFLSPLTWQGIFQAFVYPPYRTPALYIGAQPFFALPLGMDAMDAAQLLNVLLYGAVIVLTWLIARRMAGVWTSLLAALVVALLPMMAAMSRLFYTEIFLTAAVALNLLALYRCRGFANRNWSLVWGVSAGVGMLVKWTFPIYLALPVLVVIWREGRGLWHGPVWRPRAALWAVLGALVFVALWWLPNRTIAATLPSSNWMALGWLLLAGATLYALFVAPVHGRWLGGSFLLGVWIASLWYLPHSDFLQTLFATDMERGSDPLGALDWSSYATYIEYWYQQHLGALVFWLVIPAALIPWLWRLVRRRESLVPAADLLWLSLLSGTLVLVLLSQRNARNLAPLLPQVAVLTALGLGAWPRPWRWLLSGVAVAVLALQWAAVTFDGAGLLRENGAQLWVTDAYAMAPASGITDLGFDLAGDLLETIASQGESGVSQSLGMLINADTLHRGILRYEAQSRGLPIVINDLAEEDATWQRLLGSQWLAIKSGDNNNVEDAGRALIGRIDVGDALFDALYTPARKWSLPGGEEVTLYYRSAGPGFPESDPERFARAQAVAQEVIDRTSVNSTIVYGTPDLAVWVGQFDPAGNVIVVPDGWDASEASLLHGLMGTVVAVVDGNTPALELWLDEHLDRAMAVGEGDPSAVLYGAGASEADKVTLHGEWNGTTLLATPSTQPVLTRAGSVVPIKSEIAGAESAGEIKWSVRILNAAGNVIAANDRPLLPNDEFGLLIPATSPAGSYQAVARLYNASTLEAVLSAEGADEIVLFGVLVE